MHRGNPESPPKPSARGSTPLPDPEAVTPEDPSNEELASRSARIAQRALRIPSDGAPHASDDTSPGLNLPMIDDPTVLQTLPHDRPTSPAQAASGPMDSPLDNGASMRVVRRRIRKVSGETDAPPPLEIQTAPAPVVIVPASPRAPRANELRIPTPAMPPMVMARVPPAVAPMVPFAVPLEVPGSRAPSWPQIEAADDFDVPPIDDEPTSEIELIPPPRSRSIPPPPAPAVSLRPPAIGVPPVGLGTLPGASASTPTSTLGPSEEEPSARSKSRTDPDLPAMQDRDGPDGAGPELHDDEGVEISLEDAPELSSEARSRDPSLALLDALAELPPDAPVIEAPKASLHPPPPPEAARGTKTTGSQSVSRATAVTLPEKNKRRKLWWEELFGDDYLRTMEVFTPAQTQTEADWIEQALGVESGAAILDVACGAGRQATALAGRGYEVMALDYSLAMLTRAAEVAQEQSVKLSFAQIDMCAMDFNEVFDAAYCVGTSFGFFDDEKNAEVARKIHRALKPHGTLLLGVVNRDHVIQRQPGMAWFEGDGCVCMEESSFNFITSRLNVKRTVIFEDGRQRETEYSLRLYSLHELGQVLHAAGFRILEVSGNPRTPAAFFGPSSRELIILAQKRGTEVVEISGMATGPYSAQPSDPPRS